MSLMGTLAGILQQQAPAGGGGGSAPVFESSNVYSSAGSSVSTCPITKPSGTASGDLLLAFICNDLDVGSTGEWSLAGWTEEYFFGNTSHRAKNLTILSKVAGGSEPADYTFAGATTVDGVAGVMVRISGQNATWLDTLTSATTYTNDATPASVDFTPSQSDCLVLQVMFCAGAAAVTASGTISGYDGQVQSSTPPAGGNDRPIIAVCHVDQTTAAATGSADWWATNTDGGSPALDTTVIALAIAPA